VEKISAKKRTSRKKILSNGCGVSIREKCKGKGREAEKIGGNLEEKTLKFLDGRFGGNR